MTHAFSSKYVIRKEKLDSTNSYALKLINDTSPVNGTVILTFNQTNGRGQQDNSWESESNKNLTISVIFLPFFLPVHLQFYLSKVISLGISDFLRPYLNEVTIKWPNDIYAGHEKIAGILIENIVTGATLSYSVCGIGLNVNQVDFHTAIPNPTSMALQTGREFELEECFRSLLSAIEHRYLQLEKGELDVLDADYLNSLYRNEGFHVFCDAKGSFEARIQGISEVGQLVLETRIGERKIFNFKEVRFVE